jgi:peptide/nickel transport system substrate-binding protein
MKYCFLTIPALSSIFPFFSNPMKGDCDMKSIRKSTWVWLSLALIASLLGACAQPATPQVQIVERTVQVVETVIVPGTAQVIEKLITPTTETPQVGGTMVLTQYSEPPTLDQQLANGDLGMNMTRWLGSTLLTYDQSGKLIGYLADSWESTPDGLIWTFHLKKNVKFHNGEPLTAEDFVYSIERTKAPDFSGLAQSNWEPVDKAEAVDPYTLKITLKNPFYPFLDNVTQFSAQPVNKKAVESAGADYGRHPIGVGPYKLKEWVQSQKVVLERNEDFNWGPAFAHAGPAYIQYLQFNILPEPATIVAGLEAGEKIGRAHV